MSSEPITSIIQAGIIVQHHWELELVHESQLREVQMKQLECICNSHYRMGCRQCLPLCVVQLKDKHC